jgi:hypothetical protein
MGAVETTYTFGATDTITSAKMNNIIDQTTMTADAVLGGSGGSGGLDIASGKLSISANAINSSRLATNSVTTNAITNGNVTPVKLSTGAPNWTSGGNVDIGTGFTDAKLNVQGDIALASGNNVRVSSITSGSLALSGGTSFNATGGSIALRGSTSTFNPHGIECYAGGSERMRITASGNVGVGTTTPLCKLAVTGTSGAQDGSGTGGIFQITTGTGGQTDDKLQFGIVDSDYSWIQAVDPGTNYRKLILNGAGGNVGVGKTNPSTALDVNGTVTATAFAGPLTGNVTGDVTGNASSASTVSNSAITAAKLDGNQSGSAPIFGVRAWVNFDGTRDSSGAVSSAATNRFIRGAGNITSVKKESTGSYTVTFTTALSDANFSVTASVSDNGGQSGANTNQFANGYQVSATQARITVTTTGSNMGDYSHVSAIIIR